MALFIAFLVGGLFAILVPGITSRATENGRELRRRLGVMFPSPLSRVLALVAVAAGIFIVHRIPHGEELIAFFLAVFLAAIITDYLLTPHSGQGETARLVILAGTAGLLVALAIFPPEYLRHALSRVNIAGISIELLHAAPAPPIDLPGATLIQSEQHNNPEVGLSVLPSVADRLRKFDEFMTFIQPGGSARGERYARLGYPNDAVKAVFEGVLLPLAECAAAVRRATISNARNLVFHSDLAQSLVISFQRTLHGHSSGYALLSWLEDGAADSSWSRIVEGWGAHMPSSEGDARQLPVCADPEALDSMVGRVSEHFGAFQEKGLESLHYPFFVASVLASRNDFSGAAEVLATWARWKESLNDGRQQSLGRKLIRFYAWRVLTVFLSGEMSGGTNMTSQQEELISAERAALVALMEVFDDLRRLRPELDFPSDVLLDAPDTPFSDHQTCATETALLKLVEKRGYKDAGIGSDEDPLLTTIQYLGKSYLEMLNSLVYRTFSERGGDEDLVDNALAVHNTTLRRFNFDCLPRKDRAFLALHVGDTLIATQLIRAREQVWREPLLARDRVCAVADLAEPMERALAQHEVDIERMGTSVSEGSSRYAERVEERLSARRQREVPAIVAADLRALERAVAALAGDPMLRLKEGRDQACQ